MKKIFLTFIITLAIIIAAFTIYVYSGVYNISQVPHDSFTTWLGTTVKENSIHKRVKDITIPPMNDTAIFVIGFEHYNEMCSTCHGGPGISPDELSGGLFPAPPEFYKFRDKLKPAEVFWIIKNGIKFTGMPAFGPTHDDRKIWAITDFLLNKMTGMSPREYQVWKKKYAGKDED